jgi:hypothetical protein
MAPLDATRSSDPLERLQSFLALSGIVPVGIFLRKIPLGSGAFWVLRL